MEGQAKKLQNNALMLCPSNGRQQHKARSEFHITGPFSRKIASHMPQSWWSLSFDLMLWDKCNIPINVPSLAVYSSPCDSIPTSMLVGIVVRFLFPTGTSRTYPPSPISITVGRVAAWPVDSGQSCVICSGQWSWWEEGFSHCSCAVWLILSLSSDLSWEEHALCR